MLAPPSRFCGMSTEVWFRNPLTYIRECAELLVPRIVWDRGLLFKNRVDPTKHAETHLPSIVQYRLLLVGDQGTAELRRGHPKTKPYAVYPTWEYGIDTIDDLERLLRTQHIPNGKGLPPDEVGVPGQEHRVVIIRPPDAQSMSGRAFIGVLRDLQFEYPKAIIHYHGTYSFAVAFGNGYGAADIDPVADARRGRVRLGSGRAMLWEEAAGYQGWVELSGYSVPDLAVARNRTMFNMRSAMWAGEHFNENLRFKVRPDEGDVIDHTSIVPVPLEISSKRTRSWRSTPVSGDKYACDHCSLAPTCKYQRDGGVCSIPDSDTAGLARYFKTRDAEQIIDGLGRLMEKQVERAERAIEQEKADGENNPEVTKELKIIFDEGVKLAKLIDPARAGGTKVGVFIGGAAIEGGAAMTPSALVAAAVAELEAQGIPRADIDTAAVATYIANKNRVAIEASARD
jgi:hypothetical protein